MAHKLKIAIWNANGLCQHAQEINLFLQTFQLDILLVSETHFTERSHMKIPNYKIYITQLTPKKQHTGATQL
jgi:exonuclease III